MLQKLKEDIVVILIFIIFIIFIWQANSNQKKPMYIHNKNKIKVQLIDSFFCTGKKEIQYIYLLEYNDNKQIIIN
jgi:hypothetical protein